MRPPPLLQLFRGFLPLLSSSLSVHVSSFNRIFFFFPKISLSFHRSCTLQHISPYIDSLVVPYFLFFLFSLFRSFFFFFSFLISILPFLISSFLPCSILLLSSRLLHLLFLCLIFARVPLDYSIDPHDSLTV